MTRVTWRQRFVRSMYADQNDSRAVRAALAVMLQELGEGRGINIGGGPRRLDQAPGPPGRRAPSQLRLRRRRSPPALRRRYLRPGGLAGDHRTCRRSLSGRARDGAGRTTREKDLPPSALHDRLPPGPGGLLAIHPRWCRRLLRQAGVAQAQIEIAVGPGTGFYRILVEFLAGLHRTPGAGMVSTGKRRRRSVMLPGEVVRQLA